MALNMLLTPYMQPPSWSAQPHCPASCFQPCGGHATRCCMQVDAVLAKCRKQEGTSTHFRQEGMLQKVHQNR